MDKISVCVFCEGTRFGACRACGGSGFAAFNPWEATSYAPTHCHRCGGTGRDPEPDPVCKGTGVDLKKPIHVEVAHR
jgi:DnaJ-class molecular chaperone